MKLPKIKNENLPEELKQILGDADLEFDAIVNPEDIIDVQIDPDSFYESRLQTAESLIKARQELEDRRLKEKRSKSNN
ncbi:hypothetical protein Syn7803C76_204 [Synechococcus phage ACG-2014b]|jgi:hypothetical protein|uniref:Uncharacterized protein n=2 Tax=Synechococcus phage ACG-2014b TaxID=1493508 RepID=A0A0E3FYP9_9CAUD|nr:hypothetical protein ABF04_gp204 [Synechococcus phage ACG-2014b]YP_009779830.1 hypothetical protein HOQ67_gp202 [Synechococcus phage ACG-2014b]YP_009780048.1 hypothetical protein HOQ68_gp205 [Synechococcus phage ACG-2014b]AIX17424.1 hypothetical protein Syn7803C61_202 [Synechococcus phage ACG-2014b]AIX17639.1 hypothetical protein Syn7803C66_202 [Synechococcus phage ACG-2014b]AIX17855.1 hypothetical protein Syn7803C67_203 [Synechococcus phage ACG-2014b]AIX18071.1 hypothetical protein Syn780